MECLLFSKFHHHPQPHISWREYVVNTQHSFNAVVGAAFNWMRHNVADGDKVDEIIQTD